MLIGLQIAYFQVTCAAGALAPNGTPGDAGWKPSKIFNVNLKQIFYRKGLRVLYDQL
jgi:hypothetical protein